MAQTQLTPEQQGRIEEFRAIHEEMLYALRERVWGIASFAALSAALIAFAEKNRASWLHLTVIVISVPFLCYTVYLERIRLRIIAFIRAITESSVPGMTWENDLLQWRSTKEVTPLKAFDRTRYVGAILGVYDAVAVLCFFRFLEFTPSQLRLLACIPLCLVLLCNMWFFKVLSSYSGYYAMFKRLEKNRRQEPNKTDSGGG